MSDPHRYLASLQPLAMRLGLDRMERALGALGRPERGLRILHVAGTNGKGSTCAMAAQGLREAGYRTGLYTSPHLSRFNERIAVDGVMVSDAELDELSDRIRQTCPWHDRGSEAERLTYFEFATLLALLHFSRSEVDAAVVEVGLGGRFDATNVVHPVTCAVTRIGLDHVELLGDTLAAIAGEKAGIFKRDVPVAVTDAQPREALDVLRSEAGRRGAPLTVGSARYDGPVALAGAHQRENAALAAAALRLFASAGGLRLGEEEIRRGIRTARWPGRLETVSGVLLDGAHNPDGAAALAAALPALHPGKQVELVFGVLADKDHVRMLAALAPAVRSLHLVPPPSPRARAPATYLHVARALGHDAHEHASMPEAIACARAAGADGAVVCVAGSLYLAGEARRLLLDEGATDPASS